MSFVQTLGTKALSMRQRLLPVLAALTLLASAGCDALVGGDCADDYVQCGHTCVNLQTSADNCGACGAVCTGMCSGGACMPIPDGGLPPDGGGTAGTTGTAGSGGSGGRAGGAGGTAGTAGAAGRPDGGTTDGAKDGGPSMVADAGVNDAGSAGTSGTAGASGTAGTSGTADGGVDAPSDTSGAPADASATDADNMDAPGSVDAPSPVDAPAIDAPELADAEMVDVPPPIDCGDAGLSLCGNTCENLTTDPDNCGACGARCVSGLCVASACVGRTAGHLVVIGHDYAVPRAGLNNLIGNAVFMSQSTPVKVIALEGDTTAASIAGANAAINQVAATLARTWTRTVVTASNLPAASLAADVIVIYAQTNASNATLMSIASDPLWAPALTAFVNAGKTLILTDGNSTMNSGTFQLLPGAMFNGTMHTDVTTSTLTVTAPGDAVAARVPLTYRAESTSVSFDSTDQTAVVKTMGGQAVVVHSVF